MRTKSFKIKALYILIISTVIIIFFITPFIISSIRADFLYQKAVSQTKPYLESKKIEYYNRVLSWLTKAIALSQGNADYYENKADYLLEAVDDDLGERLHIETEEAEYLYKKAIELNPINFKYYLKLGWFYTGEDIDKAEELMLKSAQLYPTEYQVFLYLYRFYLKTKKYKNAFGNLILSLYYGKRMQWKFLRKIKKEIENTPQLVLDGRRKELRFITRPEGSLLDFKKEGFPHAQIPLEIKIYATRPIEKPTLYAYDSLYDSFESIEVSDELNIYEFTLDSFPPKTYLDSFKVKLGPPSHIEKIEFINKY